MERRWVPESKGVAGADPCTGMGGGEGRGPTCRQPARRIQPAGRVTDWALKGSCTASHLLWVSYCAPAADVFNIEHWALTFSIEWWTMNIEHLKQAAVWDRIKLMVLLRDGWAQIRGIGIDSYKCQSELTVRSFIICVCILITESESGVMFVA